MEKLSLKEVRAAAAMIRALNQEDRLKIVRLLETGEHRANEIMNHIRQQQSVTGKHLSILFEQDLVTRKKTGRDMSYRLNGWQLQKVTAAIAMLQL